MMARRWHHFLWSQQHQLLAVAEVVAMVVVAAVSSDATVWLYTDDCRAAICEARCDTRRWRRRPGGVTWG